MLVRTAAVMSVQTLLAAMSVWTPAAGARAQLAKRRPGSAAAVVEVEVAAAAVAVAEEEVAATLQPDHLAAPQ
jgi:hypothetical protein